MEKEKVQTEIVDLARWTQSLVKLNGGSAAPQLENIVQVQEGIVEQMEDFVRNWFQRRQDGTQNAFKTLHEVINAGNTEPAAVIQAITEWQCGYFERLSADMQDWRALCVRCVNGAMAVESNVVPDDTNLDGPEITNSKSASRASGKGDEKADGKDALKSRSTGHATPV